MIGLYTNRERTERNYTVGNALASVKRRLKGAPVCTNAISGRDLKEPITLEQLNELADEMYHDSIYFNEDSACIL